MKKYNVDLDQVHRSIRLLIALLVLLAPFCLKVSAVTRMSLLIQPYTTVTVPPVILQAGIAGTSTIYTNNTSSKVSVTAPVPLEHGYAFKSSQARVTTTSGSSVDDSQAVLSITLEKNSTIFIIYNAGNKLDSTESQYGKGCAINVDGVDKAFSWQSPSYYRSNAANSVTVVYAASLTAGSHTIKGRFFSIVSGYTVGIDTRQIAAFWFPTVTAGYVRSTTVSTTTSGTPVDDPQAVLTISPNKDSIAFIIYNAGNQRGSTLATSMGITLSIDGTDIATRQWQIGYGVNEANSVTIAYVISLAAGSHTIKGRFFSYVAGYTTTINERQLVAFCFPSDSISYGFKESSTSVSTSSGSFVDDTETLVNSNLRTDSDCLVMYVGGNNRTQTEDYDGKGVRIKIDDTDKTNSTSWQSTYDSNRENSATSLWCEQLSAGSHTVKGRFSANYAGYTVTVSNRQLLILAFHRQNANDTFDHVLKVVNQVSDSWTVNLRAYGSSNIGRLTSLNINFHDGTTSTQITISNGAITQSEGNPYSLLGTATIYISMINLQSNTTGTSYLYLHLKILVPSTTTYSLFIIAFEIT